MQSKWLHTLISPLFNGNICLGVALWESTKGAIWTCWTLAQMTKCWTRPPLTDFPKIFWYPRQLFLQEWYNWNVNNVKNAVEPVLFSFKVRKVWFILEIWLPSMPICTRMGHNLSLGFTIEAWVSHNLRVINISQCLYPFPHSLTNLRFTITSKITRNSLK